MFKFKRNIDPNKPKRKRKTVNTRTMLIVIVFIVYFVTQLLSVAKDTKPISGELGINELYELIEDGQVQEINITKNSTVANVLMADGTYRQTVNPQNDTFIYELLRRGANVTVQKTGWFDAISSVLLALPMIIVMAIFVVFLTNSILGGSTKMFTLLKPGNNNVTFDDIKGLGNTKEQIQFAIDQFENYKELSELGARPCRGMLLYGPPGTGKTMLAKAIANKAHVPFISASGSDFSEVFVGVGAGRVRSLYSLAAENAPCIVFIDEIDCLGKRRSGGDGGTQENNQTLNALLQKMDGLNESSGILFIAATNRLSDLDEALVRPGRFDRQIYIGPPKLKKDRDEIVEIYLKNKKLADGVTLEKASKLLVGLTGAQIEAVFNEAVYVSLQDKRNGVIKLSDIDEAVMRLVTKGVKEEHSVEMDSEIAAVHEAGHALVNLLCGIPVSKVSIIPYSSGMGGVTVRDLDIEGDKQFRLKNDFLNDIKVLLAGKCAEDIRYTQHSQGCQNDLREATKLIIECYMEYGQYSDKHMLNELELVRIGAIKEVTNESLKMCDNELLHLEHVTSKILRDNIKRLYKLSEVLVEQKTIVGPTLSWIDSLIEKEQEV